MVVLKPVTEDNYKDVIALRVKESQKGYVASNVLGLAECYVYRENNDVFPFALYDNQKLVGFALIYSDDEDRSMTVWRMMIDQSFQHQGYGGKAMQAILNHIVLLKTYDKVYTTFSLTNTVAQKLYTSLGFVETDLNEYGEMVMVKSLGE